MALQGWDKNYREQLKIQQQEIESLQQQLMISGGREPNEEDAPYRPAPIPNPGQPPWPGYPNPPKLASLQIRPNQIMLPFVPEEAETDDMYGDGIEELEGLGDSASGMNYPPPSELDKWLQLYQRDGGSLRHLDPDLRRLILQRGAMKAQGGNPFSTDALDKQKQIQDYLNNDQKVRELLIRQKKMKA